MAAIACGGLDRRGDGGARLCAIIVAVELGWTGPMRPRWLYPLYGVAHAVQQWGAIVALIGIAERYWNRDAPLAADC